jgi:hypothetical protein
MDSAPPAPLSTPAAKHTERYVGRVLRKSWIVLRAVVEGPLLLAEKLLERFNTTVTTLQHHVNTTMTPLYNHCDTTVIPCQHPLPRPDVSLIHGLPLTGDKRVAWSQPIPLPLVPKLFSLSRYYFIFHMCYHVMICHSILLYFE